MFLFIYNLLLVIIYADKKINLIRVENLQLKT